MPASMHKSPHPLACPGWLCGSAQTEKRSWLELRWRTALRTLAGLAGHPTVCPAVNLCYILSVKSCTQIQHKHLHTLEHNHCHPPPPPCSPYSKRELQLDGYSKPLEILSLYQFHDHILLLSDPARTPLASDMRDTATASINPE